MTTRDGANQWWLCAILLGVSGCAVSASGSIWVVTVGDPSGPPMGQRPGVLVAGNLEGDHLAGSHLALEAIRYLIQNADQLLEILERVDSEWLGLNLDIGSFRTEDPYQDIARAAPHGRSRRPQDAVAPRRRQAHSAPAADVALQIPRTDDGGRPAGGALA